MVRKALHNLTGVSQLPLPPLHPSLPYNHILSWSPTGPLLHSSLLLTSFPLPCPACAGLLIFHSSAIAWTVPGYLDSKASRPGFQSQNPLVKVADPGGGLSLHSHRVPVQEALS